MVKNFAAILLITVCLFLVCDFILSHIGLTPDYVFKMRFNQDIRGIEHPVYHHDLKHNLDIIDVWGSIQYRLCTNTFGFKVSCDRNKETRKDFDIAFIGDSFTESIGMTYEDSFVGLYARNNPDVEVVNLGVASYSPSIYFKKIELLLNKGFTFKHVVVLPDISDIRDEALWYDIDEKKGVIIDNIVRKSYEEYNKQKKRENIFHNILMDNFMFTWHINCRLYDYFTDDGTKYKLVKDVVKNQDAAWTRGMDSPYFDKEAILAGIAKNLEYMGKLKHLLDKHNIKMTIVVYPWSAQLFFEDEFHLGMQIWKDFCIKEDCYNFIDTNQFFFDAVRKTSRIDTINKYYIYGDVHFNIEGNKALFAIINEHFKP
jgi:hypothetical protein